MNVDDTTVEETHVEEPTLEQDEISTEEVETQEEVTTEEPAPAYEPVMTYNFRKEAREIPEQFKSIITDQESNDLVRNLFEKSDGLDFMKERRDQARAELETYRNEVTPKLQKFEDFNHFLEAGDIASARRVLGITDEQIAQEAIRLIRMQDAPQGVQQANPDLALQMRDQQRQNETLQAQLQEQNTLRAQSEFDMAIQQNAAAINAYESKFGQDSFKTMVATHGMQQEQMGRKLSISEAVNEVMERYNLSSFAPQVAAPVAPAQTQPTTQQAPATFPAITTKNSGSTSAVAQNVKSFDDLVALSAKIGA